MPKSLLNRMIHWIKQFIEDPEYKICQAALKVLPPEMIPDKMYLKWLFHYMYGRVLDLNNPISLLEKLQWLKLYDRKPLYTTLVDKYRAKIWLEENFGTEHIIPTLKIYNSVKDVSLEELPCSFAIKCNHDSGSVFICHNKAAGIYLDKHMNKYTYKEVMQVLEEGLKHNYYHKLIEWPYKNVKPCIICEKLMIQQDGTIPNDYKLFFINGKFQFVYVSYDREGINDRCMYDKDWNRLPFVYVLPTDYYESINTSNAPCPKSFNEMISYGEKIAENFKFVRIDFYDVDGKMYFGEVTPFHSGGFAEFYPKKYGEKYGTLLKLK